MVAVVAAVVAGIIAETPASSLVAVNGERVDYGERKGHFSLQAQESD